MKKSLKSAAIILAASMTVSVMPLGYAAGGVSISGVLKPGYTITGSYDGDAEYSWYRLENETDEGVLIEGASDSGYKLTNADGGKYIKCVATVADETVSSNAVLIDEAILKYTRGDIIGGTASTNEIYKFSLADDAVTDYILLDTTEDENSKFYVMTSGYFGNHSFDTRGSDYSLFDPDNDKNIAFWLNNGFITDGVSGKKLPQQILDNIDYNHEWLTDAVKGGSDYLTTCGLSFISIDEAIKYAGKYGYNEFNNGRWWTRSSVHTETDNQRTVPAPIDTNGKIYGTGATDNTPKVRPVFYLGRDFFMTEKIDVGSMGTEVKNTLTANYEKTELQSIYTEEQLIEIGFAPEPDESLTVSNVTINGTLKPGYTLSGNYTWENETEEAAEGSIYKWYRCESAGDAGTVVGTEKTYKITNADGGKYIRFEVIPKSAGGVYGTACASSVLQMDEPLLKLTRTDSIGGTKETNAIYKFSLKDDSTTEYILLDTADNESSKFYIMTAGYFGNHTFDTGDGAKFDPENDKNIAYWLNNGFKTDGVSGVGLPQQILDNIDYNHEWLTDAVKDGDDYLTTCGISLISINEAIAYKGKYGYGEFGSNRWWTRSTVNLTDGRRVPAPMDADGTIWGTGSTDSSPKVRPVFWVGSDFFKTVPMDFATMGLEVRKVLCENYQKSDLNGLYTEEQLVEIGFAPEQDENLTVSNVSVSGTLKPGYTVSGTYTWTDITSEAGSIYKWYRCETAEDAGTVVGTEKTYKLTNADGGKHIRFEVIPKNTDGVYGAICSSGAYPAAEPIKKLSRNDIIGGTADANAEYKFALANDSTAEYILLDTADDNQSKFYVMTANHFGSSGFDSGNSSAFDPANDKNIAYWLNHAFKTEGGDGRILPDDILGHIDHEHEWLTDAVAGENDYLVTCGIALISIDEAIKYAGKYGYNEFNNNRWWTRSSVNLPGGRTVPAPMNTNGTIHGTGATDDTPKVRPVFWLDRDFFKTVKLDTSKLGTEVINLVSENYARDELSGLYSDEELEVFGYTNCDVYDVQYTDVNGNKVCKLDSSVVGLKVSARFASYAEDIGATMIVSMFDKNGGMYAIGIDQKNMQMGISQEFTVDMSGFDIQDGTTMKVMFWDNFLDMKPLVKDIKF